MLAMFSSALLGLGAWSCRDRTALFIGPLAPALDVKLSLSRTAQKVVNVYFVDYRYSMVLCLHSACCGRYLHTRYTT